MLTFLYDVLNLTTAPMKRAQRETWFRHAWAPKLSITALQRDERKVMIQRTHDTPNLSKYACQFSAPVEPGDVARFGYVCEGGLFVDEHYWRLNVPRYTRHLTLKVHQRGASLSQCGAVEEQPDGSEVVVTDDILWDQTETGVTMTVTRDYLCPNQALTLKWEI